MRLKLFCLILLSINLAQSADSVDVVFRYQIAGKSAVYLVGEFNGWNNSIWPMTNISGDTWTRTTRLAIGGNPAPPVHGVSGAWQYKFYYANASPWPNDPLNHHVNTSDNDNTFIITKDPTIYQFLPNQRNPIVNSSYPTISAYIFPKVGTQLDTSLLSLRIDSVSYTGLGVSYNFITRQFAFTPPSALPNGNHTVILTAGTTSDTVTFTTRGGFVQLLNQFPFTTLKNTWPLNGTVGDSLLTSVRIIRNMTDTFIVPVTNKSFSYNAALNEGANTFVALADSAGILKSSSPVVFYRKINHLPNAVITFSQSVDKITLSSSTSTDPDSGQSNQLTYQWSVDPANPEYISGVDGSTSTSISVNKPTTSGEYYFTLIANDPNGNKDTTRNYFILLDDKSVVLPTLSSNPSWARKARMYFLFPKAFSSTGTINAAALKLQYIKDLGFNVIWLMPVMKNAYPIDNGVGPGYNIVDFYNVAPEYGTNQDLKNFVSQAHAKGIKVILDITPNHSSRYHPWSDNAHIFKTNSPYWNWYQHQDIAHNTNGLGESPDPDNFWHYDGWDQLLNLNWTDIDLRFEMINIFKYWIMNFGVDGYRFDVYWGPHRRYGEQYMGKPVRDALKHIKPDILLLAEDDGTGGGTETIYADYSSMGISGGVDASYDFKLYRNQIVNFGFTGAAIINLQNEIDNSGYYPGENSLYMRFMESQDEDRIFYTDPNPSTYYNSDPTTAFKKTMPMASVIFTAPGFPMLWNGQELGWGYGISGSKLARNRSVINWNFQGNILLTPHYQKLANIRGQFPAFTQHKRDTNHDGYVSNADSSDFVKIASTNNFIYAFTRPYSDQNGLTVVNVANSEQTTILNLTNSYNLNFSYGIHQGTAYYLNNLYGNSREQVFGSNLDSVLITLPAYGTAIYTVSLTQDSVIIANPLSVQVLREIPQQFALSQNYPNPFNPITKIEYAIPMKSNVKIIVYDVLGREVEILVDAQQSAGSYEVTWYARNAASGIYFYRMTTERFSTVQKMLLIR
jgi:glycosidase